MDMSLLPLCPPSQMTQVDTMDAYQSVMPYYMWPVPHSESAKKVLDLIMQEGRVKGTAFRRKILQEMDVGIKLKTTK